MAFPCAGSDCYLPFTPTAPGGQHGLVQSLRGISAYTANLYANHRSVAPRPTRAHVLRVVFSPVAIYLLYGWLGPAAFVSLAVVLLLMPIKFFIFQCVRHLHKAHHVARRPYGL
jgi:hypothetical protein